MVAHYCKVLKTNTFLKFHRKINGIMESGASSSGSDDENAIIERNREAILDAHKEYRRGERALDRFLKRLPESECTSDKVKRLRRQSFSTMIQKAARRRSESITNIAVDGVGNAVQDGSAEQEASGTHKSNLNLVVIGHVDAGKSTLMGHLLFLKVVPWLIHNHSSKNILTLHRGK